MIYELVNPHDPYTFEAPTPRVAALVCLILGSTAYGATPADGDSEKGWPVMLFATEADIESEFDRRWGCGIKASVDADRGLLPSALRSLSIPGERSSLTDLVTKARVIADQLDKDVAEASA